MKTINISAEVYAAIWRNHRQGEETENEILKRLLLASGNVEVQPNARRRKTKWIDDVVTGLNRIGGNGHLSDIYDAVFAVRKENGHRLPIHAEAIVRRVLEQNCPQTRSFTGQKELFVAPDGVGAGYWALR